MQQCRALKKNTHKKGREGSPPGLCWLCMGSCRRWEAAEPVHTARGVEEKVAIAERAWAGFWWSWLGTQYFFWGYAASSTGGSREPSDPVPVALPHIISLVLRLISKKENNREPGTGIVVPPRRL